MSQWGANSAASAQKPSYTKDSSGVGYAQGDLSTHVTGVTAAQVANNKSVAHSGWQLGTVGQGGIGHVNITSPGTGYANGEAVAANSGAFAGTIVTNGSGVVTGVNITTSGSYTTAPTLTVTTAAGTGLTVSPVLGGRAGRITYETLVAMGSIK